MSSVHNHLNDSIYHDNRLKYKGHGQIESATESSSIAHVMGHELTHVAEFRAEARREGSHVHSIDVKIDYEIRNGKLVAVSGETKALTYKKPEALNFSQDEESEVLSMSQNSSEETDENIVSNSQKEQSSSINNEYEQTESELNRVNQQIQILRNSKQTQDQENVKKLEARKEELEIQKREYIMQNLLKDISQEISKTSNQLLMMNVTGNFVDLSV